jgi:hypothetical protein
VYVAAYLPTRNSSATVAASRRLWMFFILWMAVGFDRYRAGSEQPIYSTYLRAIPIYSAMWGGLALLSIRTYRYLQIHGHFDTR